jgi:hypothetical protein
MNVFGAVTILVALFGASGGAWFSAFLLRNTDSNSKFLIIVFAALLAGYLSLKGYYWILRKMDEQAKTK